MVLSYFIKIHNSESYGQNKIYVPIEIIKSNNPKFEDRKLQEW